MPVQVSVVGPVAQVELVLDGRPAGTLSPPGWAADVELGSQVAPHELVARALGSDHAELARARQWLNLPRPPAEVEIQLEHGKNGAATAARLSWESVTGEQPQAIRASFNGGPLAVSSDRVVALPAYEPEQAQLLTVELEFAHDVRARKDVVLGGRTGEEAGSELTAIPIRVGENGKGATAAVLRRSFQTRTGPLEVAAVEEGDALLEVVRDVHAARGLGRWNPQRTIAGYRDDLSLGSATTVRFLWPRPATYRGERMPVELFPTSREFHSGDGGLRWILTRVTNPQPEPRAPRFADAIAVAALHAYGTFRRRAVLLVLDADAEDASQYDPSMVQRFLASLRVPLFVWSLGPLGGTRASWTGAVDVSTENALRDSFERIKDALTAQRIVWVEGKILPQDVALTEQAKGIELVR